MPWAYAGALGLNNRVLQHKADQEIPQTSQPLRRVTDTVTLTHGCGGVGVGELVSTERLRRWLPRRSVTRRATPAIGAARFITPMALPVPLALPVASVAALDVDVVSTVACCCLIRVSSVRSRSICSRCSRHSCCSRWFSNKSDSTVCPLSVGASSAPSSTLPEAGADLGEATWAALVDASPGADRPVLTLTHAARRSSSAAGYVVAAAKAKKKAQGHDNERGGREYAHSARMFAAHSPALLVRSASSASPGLAKPHVRTRT